MKRISLLVAFALMLASCAYNKQCYGNGVCRIEKDGQVSWDGPPEEVAKMKGDEDKQKQQAAALDNTWAEAPKRPETEPIRLGIVGPTAATPALAAHASTYRAMLEASVQGDPRIQLVPASQVRLLAGAESVSSSRGGFNDEKKPRTAVDEGLTRMLRDTGADVDVVLVVHVAPKTVSGFVSGGGGVGVAEVVNPEFQASLSSIYRFAEQKSSAVGKSTDSLALAGIGKDGKASSGELKGKRNPESDRPAIQQVGVWVKATIRQQISPELPSVAAVKEIREKHSDANPASPLLKLFKRK
jgi:hypothetical protein